MSYKVIVISNFHEDAMVSRSNMAYKYFVNRGYNTIVLYSSFSHSLKKVRYINEENHIAIQTLKYSSNLSVARILSHIIFAYRVFKFLSNNYSDIIYLNLPPNTLALSYLLLKKRKRAKVIVDIIDLWPEAFPCKNMIYRVIFNLLGVIPKCIRQKAISNSDFCITESDYFYRKLKLSEVKNSKTIYLKKFQTEVLNPSELSELLSFAYLGNFGSIYDFDSFFMILKLVNRKRLLHLHIIGSGPLRKWFLRNLELLKIDYTDHGVSFDEKLKKKVLSVCWFGFNGYKQTTEVALSYKSIDYLSYGVPLLNSAKEDTYNIVATENIGLNFNSVNLYEQIAKLCVITREEVKEMKRNVFVVFENKFSGDSYYVDMDNVLCQLNAS